MIKAVFFDLYQTLVRYKPSQEELEAKALENLGFKTTAEALARPILAANEFMYNRIAKKPLSRRTKEEIMALYTEYQRVVMKEAGINADESIISRLMEMMQQVNMELVLFDDTLPALAEVKKRGIKTGLISNIEKNMNDVLQKLGISPKLDIVVTSIDAGSAKPQPEIFRYALQKAGVEAGEAIYVGDQYGVDMKGAKTVGMKGILLDRTGYYTDKIDTPKIKSLREVVGFLD